MVSWILSRAALRDALPGLRLLQGCEDEKHPGICPMDDVLDRLCSLHDRGDLHRRPHLLVPLLLRGEDGFYHLAAVPVHAGGQPALPPLRAPHAGPQGEGHRRVPGPCPRAQLRDRAALWQEGLQPGGHRRHPGSHQEPGRAGRAAPQLQHARPALPARAGARALPGPAVPGGAGGPPAAPGPPLRERVGRGGAVVGLAGVPLGVPMPGCQTPVPLAEPENPEEEPRKRGLLPAPAQPDQEESGSVRAGELKMPGNLCQEAGEEFAAAASGGTCGSWHRPGWLLHPWRGSWRPQGGSWHPWRGSWHPWDPHTVNPFPVAPGGGGSSSSPAPQLGAGASPVGSGPSFSPIP